MPAKQRQGAHDAKAPAHRRFNASLREESLQRLMLHAVMTRKGPGEILSDLIDLGLREFRVQRNPTTRVTSNDRLDMTGPVNENIPDAATAA